MRELNEIEIQAVQGGEADFSNVKGGFSSTEEVVEKPNWHDFLPGMGFKSRA